MLNLSFLRFCMHAWMLQLSNFAIVFCLFWSLLKHFIVLLHKWFTACYYTHLHQFSFQCVQWTLDLTDSWKWESPVYFVLARSSQDQSRDYNISEMLWMLWRRADRWIWVRSGRRPAVETLLPDSRYTARWTSATVCHTLATHAYTTAPKIGVSEMFKMFLKEVSSAHQGCIYFIKIQ